MSIAGKWHVNGSANHPILAESIKWSCEAKPTGKVMRAVDMQHGFGNDTSGVTGMIPQSQNAISHVSKQIVEELRGVRTSVDAFNHHHHVLAALPFVTYASQKAALVAQLINSVTPKSNQPCRSMYDNTDGNPTTPCEGSVNDTHAASNL
jgi:hypothetical protein